VEVAWVFLQDTLEELVDNCEFGISFVVVQNRGVVLSSITAVDEKGGVTTIINNQLWS